MDSVWLMYEMHMERLIIYPKDVMIVTGKTERHARYLLQRIKKALEKEEHQVITIAEFAEYLGVDLDEVKRVIFI